MGLISDKYQICLRCVGLVCHCILYNQGVGFEFTTNFPMLPCHLLSVTHIPVIDQIYLMFTGYPGVPFQVHLVQCYTTNIPMLPYHLSSYSFPLVGTMIYVIPDAFEVGDLVGIPGNYLAGQFWVHLAQCYTTDFPTLPFQQYHRWYQWQATTSRQSSYHLLSAHPVAPHFLWQAH